MELINAVIERKVGMVENENLSPELRLINQYMMELDLVIHKLTLKWGVGRLQELAPPELKAKFDSQMKKLNDAIMNSDVILVQELIGGAGRGWLALEAAAVKAGHLPYEAQFWEVMAGDAVYRVVRFREDLETAPKGNSAALVCLDELVNGYHAQNVKTFSKRAPETPEAQKPFVQDLEIGF
jgi:hypothetical protein